MVNEDKENAIKHLIHVNFIVKCDT